MRRSSRKGTWATPCGTACIRIVRKNKTPAEALQDYEQTKSKERMFMDQKIAPLQNLKKQLAATGGTHVHFVDIEHQGVDESGGQIVYFATALYEVEGPAKGSPGTKQYALAIFKGDAEGTEVRLVGGRREIPVRAEDVRGTRQAGRRRPRPRPLIDRIPGGRSADPIGRTDSVDPGPCASPMDPDVALTRRSVDRMHLSDPRGGVSRAAVIGLPEDDFHDGQAGFLGPFEDEPGDVFGRRVLIHDEDALAPLAQDGQQRIIAAEQQVVIQVLVDPVAGPSA